MAQLSPHSEKAAVAGVLFDRATNVALVLALIFVGLGIWRRPASESRPSQVVSYKTGETLPAISGFDYGQGKGTLVLFVHSQCHFCTETMPVYREVRDTLARQNRANVRLVAIARQSEPELMDYLKNHNLTIDHASAITRDAWQKLAGTPTLFLVDSKGVIKEMWRGKQEQTAAAAIVSAVARLAS